MDDVVEAANELKYAQERLECIMRISRNVVFFSKVSPVQAEYVLKNDGGDASNKGFWEFRLTCEEVAARLKSEVEKAEAEVQKYQAALYRARSRYQLVSAPVNK